MGIFRQEYPAGHPNGKVYSLVYEDGEPYTFRQPGRDPIREWNLASAVTWANHVTSDGGGTLSVVDPDTRAVLWVGEMSTRSR